MNDHELVRHCLQMICERSGFESSHKLTQRDLEFLCDAIEEKTSILISLSTLKRLLNGQFSRLPQVATLNAISSYLGYENWQAFTVQQKAMQPAAEPVVTASAPPAKKRISFKLVGIAAVILIASVIIAFSTFSKPHTNDYSKAVFSAQKTTSNQIPNTVVFHYDIDQLEGDSFFIQQSWDRNRRVRIYKNSHTLTDIYFEPGYHNAKLIVNDKIVKTVPVSIPTDRWFFYAKEVSFSSHPKYIRTENAVHDGILGIKKEELPLHDIDYQKEQIYVNLFFPSKFSVPSDNFILTARVKVNNIKNSGCPTLMCEAFCQNYFMYFNVTHAGCTGIISAQFGEKELQGQTNDLSAFSCDLTQWQHYTFLVKDRHVTISINDKAIYTGTYTQSAGLLTGLGFISNGLCEIDQVSMKGLDGKLVYENGFDE